jgi:hypothetical protein
LNLPELLLRKVINHVSKIAEHISGNSLCQGGNAHNNNQLIKLMKPFCVKIISDYMDVTYSIFFKFSAFQALGSHLPIS